MKQLKFISTIIILIGLFSCAEVAPRVTFNEPQPTETKNLSKFPNRLQGRYLSLADNSELVIGDKLIQRVYDFDLKFHSSELASNRRLSGDTIIDIVTNEREVVKRDGDSLVEHIHRIDTLFQINNDNVVRKFKGYYFLNKRYFQAGWEVKKIELSRGQLIISSISEMEDIESLKAITESTQDTVAPDKFTITKKQFKKFIKNDGFSDSETFIKTKKKNL